MGKDLLSQFRRHVFVNVIPHFFKEMGFLSAEKVTTPFPLCSHNSGLKNSRAHPVTKMPAANPMGECKQHQKTNWRSNHKVETEPGSMARSRQRRSTGRST